MSYMPYVKISDEVSVKFLKQFEKEQNPFIFIWCKTRKEVTKYFIELVLDIRYNQKNR